jgi:hypothetical protein
MSLNHLTNDMLKQSPDFRNNVGTTVGVGSAVIIQAASEKAVQDNSATSAITDVVQLSSTGTLKL